MTLWDSLRRTFSETSCYQKKCSPRACNQTFSQSTRCCDTNSCPAAAVWSDAGCPNPSPHGASHEQWIWRSRCAAHKQCHCSHPVHPGLCSCVQYGQLTWVIFFEYHNPCMAHGLQEGGEGGGDREFDSMFIKASPSQLTSCHDCLN